MKFSTSALDTVNLTGVPARGQMACGIKEVYRAFTFAMPGEDIADLIKIYSQHKLEIHNKCKKDDKTL